MQILSRYLELFFPEERVEKQNLSLHHRIILFGLLTIIFSILGLFIPTNGIFAFDWLHFFLIKNIPPFYPPWTYLVVNFLTWPILVGLTMTAVGFASFQRAQHIISLACVFFTLPFLWTLFLGQIDGLVLLGILGLPWLAPLVLIKPQVSIFSFLARKSYLLGLGITLLISFVLWGFWPSKLLMVWTVHAEGRYPNDIAIGWLGLPLSLFLMWYSRGDIDMLMLAGTFTTPYLLPYNLIVVVPAIARLQPRTALIALALSWTPMVANWIGPGGWWFGWLFITWLWISLAVKRYPYTIFSTAYRKLGLSSK